MAGRTVGQDDRAGIGIGLDRAGPDRARPGQDQPGGHPRGRALGDRDADASPGGCVGDALQDKTCAGVAAPAQLTVERFGADDSPPGVSDAVEAGCERQGRSRGARQSHAGSVDQAIQPRGLGHRTPVRKPRVEIQTPFEGAQSHVAHRPHPIERAVDANGGGPQRQRRGGVRHHRVADHACVSDVVVIDGRLVQGTSHAERDIALAGQSGRREAMRTGRVVGCAVDDLEHAAGVPQRMAPNLQPLVLADQVGQRHKPLAEGDLLHRGGPDGEVEAVALQEPRTARMLDLGHRGVDQDVRVLEVVGQTDPVVGDDAMRRTLAWRQADGEEGVAQAARQDVSVQPTASVIAEAVRPEGDDLPRRQHAADTAAQGHTPIPATPRPIEHAAGVYRRSGHPRPDPVDLHPVHTRDETAAGDEVVHGQGRLAIGQRQPGMSRGQGDLEPGRAPAPGRGSQPGGALQIQLASGRRAAQGADQHAPAGWIVVRPDFAGVKRL